MITNLIKFQIAKFVNYAPFIGEENIYLNTARQSSIGNHSAVVATHSGKQTHSEEQCR